MHMTAHIAQLTYERAAEEWRQAWDKDKLASLFAAARGELTAAPETGKTINRQSGFAV